MSYAIKIAVMCLVVTVSAGQPLSALESSTYYEEAAKGDAQAQFLLSKAYLFGKDGFEKDLAKSLHWLKKSAEAGNKKAQLTLA